MDGQPQPRNRGPRLLAAHLRSLDADRPTAQERLAHALGPQLAQRLVHALASHHGARRAA